MVGKVGYVYLGVIGLADAKEGLERVIGRNDETSRVDEELASNVEEDEEEVEGSQAQDDVDLGYRRLLLEVGEGRVL
jgi:hypothetical protein